MQQTFEAGTAQRIALTRLEDTLRVRGWEQQSIQVSSKGPIATLQVEGDTLVISGCQESLELAVPYETIISASRLQDKVSIENVRQVEIRESKDDIAIEGIQGDVNISNIAGSVVLKNIKGTATLGDISDDLSIIQVARVIAQGELKGDAFFSGIGQLEVQRVKNSASLQDVEQAVLESIGNDMQAWDINAVRVGSIGNECRIEGRRETDITIERVGNNLTVKEVAHLQVNSIGNNCQVHASPQATVSLGSVGNDLTVEGAAQVQVRNTGDNCRLLNILGSVTLGRVGNSLLLESIGGNIETGHIGSDATLQGIHGSINMGRVGADIHVQADFPPGSTTRLYVGNDARIILPENPNLTIRATAGGGIKGSGVVSHMGSSAMLRYGEGAAQLDITAGSDLEIRSDAEPSSSSSSSAWWNDFMHDMSDFERSMGQMGRDIEAEITASMSSMASAFNEDFGRKMNRNAEKQRREAERQQRKAEEQARRFGEKMARMNVRIHNREWRMDPERINRIVEQANRAASEGVYGAMEAVEQALRNMSMTPSPKPPTPPNPPTPPHAEAQEQAANERAQPEVPLSSEEDQMDVASDAPSATVNPEQEREAILRMIAEGRITPDEGDMLLEALGS